MAQDDTMASSASAGQVSPPFGELAAPMARVAVAGASELKEIIKEVIAENSSLLQQVRSNEAELADLREYLVKYQQLQHQREEDSHKAAEHEQTVEDEMGELLARFDEKSQLMAWQMHEIDHLRQCLKNADAKLHRARLQRQKSDRSAPSSAGGAARWNRTHAAAAAADRFGATAVRTLNVTITVMPNGVLPAIGQQRKSVSLRLPSRAHLADVRRFLREAGHDWGPLMPRDGGPHDESGDAGLREGRFMHHGIQLAENLPLVRQGVVDGSAILLLRAALAPSGVRRGGGASSPPRRPMADLRTAGWRDAVDQLPHDHIEAPSGRERQAEAKLEEQKLQEEVGEEGTASASMMQTDCEQGLAGNPLLQEHREPKEISEGLRLPSSARTCRNTLRELEGIGSWRDFLKLRNAQLR
mmetsp:Transcript_46420/g.110599  ORF Transcript_46420/g.110599 Transcript_46420/m.110599 type:complete len:414 (+) Transcript_46420:112-1353(+)